MKSVGRPKENIDKVELARWIELRKQGADDLAEKINRDSKDLSGIETVALVSGMGAISSRLDEAIQLARDEGQTWQSIAVALGEAEGLEASNRVKNRFFKRVRSRDTGLT